VSRRLAESYEEVPRIEDAFRAALDESLRPRSPELLYELVQGLGLPEGALVVDVGCGDGTHSHRLAERFGFSVVGVDPFAPEAEGRRVRFVPGVAEALPVEDESADLVWCRGVLVHVADLERAYEEFRRVLRDGGRALVYQTFATDRLEPREAERLWHALGVVPGSTNRARDEAAIAAAGLRVDERIDLGSEWAEWSEERSGAVGRKLLSAARLLRDPERYRARFGESAYEIMLADCLWQVYTMLGKLDRCVYLLSRRGASARAAHASRRRADAGAGTAARRDARRAPGRRGTSAS
jgi:SAM-dependent methyltransferase